MIKIVTPTPIFPLFLVSKGNSIWLPRWPKSKPMGHELARGTKKLVKFSTSGFQKCDFKKCIMRVLVSPPFLPYYRMCLLKPIVQRMKSLERIRSWRSKI